jgi:hypothetical protein
MIEILQKVSARLRRSALHLVMRRSTSGYFLNW